MADGWDSRIRYPSYMSLDSYIDVERLAGLDDYLRTRLARRLKAEHDQAFYTGPFLLDGADPYLPGTRMVRLSRSTREDDYYDLNDPDAWRHSAEAVEFAELMHFIATLPFERTARIIIMYDDHARPVSAHRDHQSTDLCHEFIWFQTAIEKPFYMLNPDTGEKRYVDTHTAWFDTVNQFHGSDAKEGLTFSIRVDGVFTESLRQEIPRCEPNRAATASLWSALSSARVG